MTGDPTCAIWWARLSALRPAHLAVLDAVERGRRDGYLHGADRDRFTLGAVLLRFAAGRELGVAPERVSVRRDCARCGRPHGRPLLAAADLFVSVAHSGDLVAVAVTRAGPVGVDVERRAGCDHARLAPAVLTAREARDGLDEASFLRCWTRKEAALKSTGDGLAVPMTAVGVGAPDDPPRLLTYPGRDPAGATLRDAAPMAGYAAAVSVWRPGVRVRALDATVLLGAQGPPGAPVPPGAPGGDSGAAW